MDEFGDILIVDDKPNNLNVQMSLLTKDEYKVHPTFSGNMSYLQLDLARLSCKILLRVC